MCQMQTRTCGVSRYLKKHFVELCPRASPSVSGLAQTSQFRPRARCGVVRGAPRRPGGRAGAARGTARANAYTVTPCARVGTGRAGVSRPEPVRERCKNQDACSCKNRAHTSKAHTAHTYGNRQNQKTTLVFHNSTLCENCAPCAAAGRRRARPN